MATSIEVERNGDRLDVTVTNHSGGGSFATVVHLSQRDAGRLAGKVLEKLTAPNLPAAVTHAAARRNSYRITEGGRS